MLLRVVSWIVSVFHQPASHSVRSLLSLRPSAGANIAARSGSSLAKVRACTLSLLLGSDLVGVIDLRALRERGNTVPAFHPVLFVRSVSNLARVLRSSRPLRHGLARRWETN